MLDRKLRSESYRHFAHSKVISRLQGYTTKIQIFLGQNFFPTFSGFQVYTTYKRFLLLSNSAISHSKEQKYQRKAEKLHKI